MKKNLLLFFAALSLCLVPSATSLLAGDKPSEDGPGKASECDSDAQSYDHGALKNFHSHLCHINAHFPGLAEEFLYRLVVKLGMNPDLTTLAADGTTTALTGGSVDGKTVAGTVGKVVSPNTFAGTYDYVATVTVDSVKVATMYWTGSGSSSKGFLIMGGKRTAGAPKRKGDTTNLLYVRWDRSTAAQQVDVLGTRFDTSFLTDPGKDDAIYGKVTYDTGTKATTVQVVEIGRQRGSSPSGSVFACWKMYATGTAGGAMRVGKTNDALSSGTGHTVAHSTQDGIDQMDDWEGNDTKTEPNGTGNGTAVQGMAMNYSCADLNGTAGASKPFNGNAVNHSMTKTEMDTMFSAN